MNNDQTFFNALTDFRDVRTGSQHEYLNNDGRQSNVSSSNCSREYDLDFNNNDKLLKNFKDLREQLKEINRSNTILKTRLTEKQNQLDQIKANHKDHVSLNFQLKNQIKRLKEQNQQQKQKLIYLKQTAKGANKSNEEVEFLKVNIYDLKNTIQSLQEENKKILQISVIEKVELQQKIKMFEAKERNEVGYVQEMEIQVSKMREKCIKLQNELKKAEIKYDEELYNKKWMNGNFQREHLEQQIKQLEKDNEDLLIKHKKQKERRNGLEKRVLELQELSGLWTVKAETYQIENKNLNKKFKKMEKKMSILKENSDKKMADSLCAQEKFMKAVNIGQQLISRVKRDLIGDAVTLAKSCEYKLNKLKEDKDGFVGSNIKDSCPRKSPAVLKGRSKSRPKLSPTRKLFSENQYKEDCEKTKFGFHESQFPTERLRQLGIRVQSNRERKQSEDTTASQNCPLTQIDNIEIKIRREREEMQKKIRQKMLYRQIEVANSPQKYRLREDYFRLLDK